MDEHSAESRLPDDVEDAYALGEGPGAFQRLWTPHRIAYISGGGRPADPDACVFCEAPGKSDEESLIVHRGELAYVLLNLFPYNPGHLMVVPYRHYPSYDGATAEEIAEIGALTQQAMRALGGSGRSRGFNIGMNQGIAAGAGIAAHLHQHVVPRWVGDTNFFPIIGETKAMPKLLGDVRADLAAAWPPA